MNQIRFKVTSDSMEPVIKIDHELDIVSDLSELQVFDIILFVRTEKLFVHFVWRNQILYNKTVITRSLKNIYFDEEPVPFNQIVGRVTNFKLSFFYKIKIFFLSFIRGKL